MAGLEIRLSAGDNLVVNGAAMHFESDARIRFANQVNVLFGKQIMAPDQANTPARRIYYALQTLHVGEPSERAAALHHAADLIREFREATTSASARALLDEVLTCARRGQSLVALKLARRIIRHEDSVLEPDSAVR